MSLSAAVDHFGFRLSWVNVTNYRKRLFVTNIALRGSPKRLSFTFELVCDNLWLVVNVLSDIARVTVAVLHFTLDLHLNLSIVNRSCGGPLREMDSSPHCFALGSSM